MPDIPKLVCEKCLVPFRVVKNGVRLQANAGGHPYYMVQSDRFICPRCGVSVFTGFGLSPESLQHEDHFAELEPAAVFDLDWEPTP